MYVQDAEQYDVILIKCTIYRTKIMTYRKNIQVTIIGELGRFKQTLKDKDTNKSRHHKYIKRLGKYWDRSKGVK